MNIKLIRLVQQKFYQTEFSIKTRSVAMERLKTEEFDLLIIGGGITGAATARDAVSRGLKVALVEKHDFAWGTSSRSSKLIHGGLRYLQNMEFKLVFEALSERKHLLKSSPNLVKPLKFYMPVYKRDSHGKGLLMMGMWLYDMLALFRAPGMHKTLSKRKMVLEIPGLNENGLKGGFSYYDASMWDDALAIETLRAASVSGAACINYAEATEPVWSGNKVMGFVVKDLEGGSTFQIKAKKVVICAGPWTDMFGEKMFPGWKKHLMPSKGAHLLFNMKRLPVPGAVVMAHPEDGRISFIIPRPDFGEGMALVGTTDGPSPNNPEETVVGDDDVEYLLNLLNIYFPKLKLTLDDIVSAYVGVRPLMGPQVGLPDHDTPEVSIVSKLQKVSREHHIGTGPGDTVVVCGGKYTTHRTMAAEIVDYAAPQSAKSNTKEPVNPLTTKESLSTLASLTQIVPQVLIDRYGLGAIDIMNLAKLHPSSQADPAGFPLLEAELRYQIRTGMVIHVEDFILRRIPLYLSRADHGQPWYKTLCQVWANELGKTVAEADAEYERTVTEIQKRSGWKKDLQRKAS
ncbi:glycerol-3-phosphate dehydrogenase/oxidase [bacterium]|nr:glycerol-3-phosphate dehydrogenase/oxidase [bacterium]